MSSARRTCVFISASIPDPSIWDEVSDEFEITDAVVAIARELLTRGSDIVTAAHPTIAPLILHVADELSGLEQSGSRIFLYQSELFRGHVPAATQRLARRPFVETVWTPSRPNGDPSQRSTWGPSLEVMRRQMFTDRAIDAAVFVGGMEGIQSEYALLTEHRPEALMYPLSRPGGAAANLPPVGPLGEQLRTLRLYPFLAQLIVDDLARGRDGSDGPRA